MILLCVILSAFSGFFASYLVFNAMAEQIGEIALKVAENGTKEQEKAFWEEWKKIFK